MSGHDGWALFNPDGRVVLGSVATNRADAWDLGWDANGGPFDRYGIIVRRGRYASWLEAREIMRRRGWYTAKILVVPVEHKDTRSQRA